jgi:L-lactate dehydrogenase (cytochrome)/(S)-mandelate dehydrogenase
VPVVSRRERELHNGFGRPRMPLRAYVEALRHPGWLAEYLRHGVPLIENWVPYAPKGASAREVVGYAQTQFPVPDHSWRDVENFRRLWPRPLLLKGILHPDDAVRAAELGVDGVIVSNHGARQLDSAPTALDMLPAIRAAVGDRLTLIVDGGVRRGADILIALALGAQFVFVGRATAYGAAAFGLPGARRAIEILRQEVEINLKQIGCTSLSQLGPHSLLRGD